MSVQEIEQRVRELPPAELRQFADWWNSQSDHLLGGASALDEASSESEAVKDELLRRQQEYRDHPERFARMDEASLKAMFGRIADARTRLTSAR